MEAGVLLAGDETWALFGYMGEFFVADDAGLGVVAVERLQKLEESGLLLRRASVGLAALRVYTALVADAQ